MLEIGGDPNPECGGPLIIGDVAICVGGIPAFWFWYAYSRNRGVFFWRREGDDSILHQRKWSIGEEKEARTPYNQSPNIRLQHLSRLRIKPPRKPKESHRGDVSRRPPKQRQSAFILAIPIFVFRKHGLLHASKGDEVQQKSRELLDALEMEGFRVDGEKREICR